MIGRSKRFLQTGCAIAADFQQTIGELGRMFVFFLHLFQAFAQGFGYRVGQALSGEPGQALGKFVGVFVFNVQAHLVDDLPFISSILPHRVKDRMVVPAKGCEDASQR